jgi:hypothetical protein
MESHASRTSLDKATAASLSDFRPCPSKFFDSETSNSMILFDIYDK